MQQTRLKAVHDWGHGITAIDSGYVRPRFDAIHLIHEKDEAALVDTGTTHSLGRVLKALEQKSLAPEQVRWIILTHVHLDHAGGAGAMMQAFPHATLAVHPRGARHMADPTHLVAGTRAVYGEVTARRLYGEIPPIDASRIASMAHESRISLAGRELLILDTPGHARHHICIVDSRSGHIFTGDTFGLSYRELDVGDRQSVFPSSAPVQFDPQAFHRTLQMLAGYEPEAVYVTHYSQVRDIPRLMADMHRLIDAHAEIALRHRDDGAARGEAIEEELMALVYAEGERQGWPVGREELRELLGPDIQLNATGLESWLDAKSRGSGS